MGFFNSKEDKNDYRNDIAILKAGQNEIKERTNKNSSDVISLGMDFTNYKSDTNETLKTLIEKIKDLESSLLQLKQEKAISEEEIKDTESAKRQSPDLLTYKDICNEIDIPYLKETTLKYFLYENGLLNLKINRTNNRYKISSKYDELDCEIKKYSHINGKVLIFDKEIIDYLKLNEAKLKESIYRYLRKLKQFNDSKENLSAIEIKNFQIEIRNICGIKDDYDEKKWAAIYNRYKLDHPNFWDSYNRFTEGYMNEHPNAQYKPTVVKYLVHECNDGDVLLKIACELFVK